MDHKKMVLNSDIFGGKSNLIGNPYPSAIDGDAFILANSGDSSALSGTLYFWTHGSEIQLEYDATKAGSGAYAYTSDYSTYDRWSRVTGTIAAGQAFFAQQLVERYSYI
jgi:hypothetical protein